MTAGNGMWSDDECNTSEQEQDEWELSDKDIRTIADKTLLNFQLHKVDWQAEYPTNILLQQNWTTYPEILCISTMVRFTSN